MGKYSPDSSFVLNVRIDNDAFQPDPLPELSRILKDIAKRLDRGEDVSMYSTIHDENGNECGQFAIKSHEYLKK